MSHFAALKTDMNQLVELIISIISIVTKVLIFFLSSGLYMFLIMKGIPKFTLKHKSVGVRTRDRGIKKYTFEDGRAVVYEPDFAYRKYVYQYMLLSKNKHKFIKCRVNESIRHIKYDVIAYDNKHKVLDVIGVEERMTDSKYTDSVLLPPDTSYVSFVLRKVDSMFLSSEVKVKYSKTSMIVCACLIILLTVLQGIIVNYCFTNLWEVLQMLKKTKPWGLQKLPTGKVVTWSGIIGAIEAALVARVYRIKNVKVINR